jgi:peptidoglycan/xylan/chitin deacetylase (PgdA/CDA1 family)
LLIAITSAFPNFSCNKTEAVPTVESRGGIALTFDDYSIDNWYNYINLFDSLQVKATFYVSNYNRLTDSQKDKLKDMQSRGHEIAFHSSNHANFLNFARENGCNGLIKKEVTEGLELMNKDGFYPTTFAYPYGKHTKVLDKLLLRYFKSVRALNGPPDVAKSLVPLHNNKVFFGLGIDESSKRSMSKIGDLLGWAYQTDRCAVMLIHNIERSETKLQIPLCKLKEIILKARSLHLKFYTVSEISG